MNWSIILLGFWTCFFAGVAIGKVVEPLWLAGLLGGITGYCLMSAVFIPWSKM